ncbi:Dynein light chain type 1 family protein [Perilla frutescens var. hirtella]|nr:Dynein light chain type 1 family protein [Perilla frutescens var. hirtella]KAH6807628.1 Dynein light chain type 1 family protein [Perilla frutescens var. frutescens]
MAHQTSHRRILAAPDSQILMDPTSRKPKPNPSAGAATATAAVRKHRHPQPIIHPLPDPTVAAPPSTIQNISHRFSKLYINHKKSHSSTKPNPHPHPQPDPNLPPFSPFSDTSCTTLTKSSSQHGRKAGIEKIAEKRTKLREKDDFKNKPSFDKDPKKSSFDENEIDVKKGSKLMDDEEKMKGFQQGGETRGRNSLSSIPPTVNGGRRRSFCSSQIELADFFSCSGVKVVAVDMPPFMQIHAVNCARKAHDSLEKFTSKTLALTLKKEFDGVYGPAWHCIVGTSFGSFVTHSVGGFMYFSMDQKLYILLFKTTVQRAEAEAE